MLSIDIRTNNPPLHMIPDGIMCLSRKVVTRSHRSRRWHHMRLEVVGHCQWIHCRIPSSCTSRLSKTFQLLQSIRCYLQAREFPNICKAQHLHHTYSAKTNASLITRHKTQARTWNCATFTALPISFLIGKVRCTLGTWKRHLRIKIRLWAVKSGKRNSALIRSDPGGMKKIAWILGESNGAD